MFSLVVTQLINSVRCGKTYLFRNFKLIYGTKISKLCDHIIGQRELYSYGLSMIHRDDLPMEYWHYDGRCKSSICPYNCLNCATIEMSAYLPLLHEYGPKLNSPIRKMYNDQRNLRGNPSLMLPAV